MKGLHGGASPCDVAWLPGDSVSAGVLWVKCAPQVSLCFQGPLYQIPRPPCLGLWLLPSSLCLRPPVAPLPVSSLLLLSPLRTVVGFRPLGQSGMVPPGEPGDQDVDVPWGHEPAPWDPSGGRKGAGLRWREAFGDGKPAPLPHPEPPVLGPVSSPVRSGGQAG